MPEVGPVHSMSYRREVVAPLFMAVGSGDSCALIGPSSMGKSRLLHFIMRRDVQQHYLDDRAGSTLLIVTDCNRMAEVSEWGFYELLLTVITEATSEHPSISLLRSELNTLRREVITSRDGVLARRHAELALHLLCRQHNLTVGIIFDEFDETYQKLPPLALANLRALRDMHKYQLSYLLVLREHPARLRLANECEGFYELFSRSILGLGPYSLTDAERVIDQLEYRKGRRLAIQARKQVLDWSGGHPGLIVALFDHLVGQDAGSKGVSWALAQATVQEECRKLWNGLADDERLGLNRLMQQMDVDQPLQQLLRLKGLLQQKELAQSLFSPLFAEFVLHEGAPIRQSLAIDEAARIVWLGPQRISDLTAREFDLLLFLYHHLGYVCDREQILAHLYPGELNGVADDNRVDTLVKRVREKIEPIRNYPQYLLTVRGKGYRLVDAPEPAA